ncbi:MAG: LD-carboxypeptidase [Saprospiraceae bacterium]|nr:LD-carboxypeptidase [Saprospiraceae bacterium]
MQRRQFVRHTIAGCLGLVYLPSGLRKTGPGLRRPPLLTPGDRVALVAPGSAPAPEKIDIALHNIQTLGLVAREGRHLRVQKGFLAGTDEQRLSDLHAAFADPDIRAIWCIRGGYGCTRLLPHLDYKLIRGHPKALIGYSDITALHLAMLRKTGLMTFHGPVAYESLAPTALESLRRRLFEGLAAPWQPDPEHPFTVRGGTARGPLVGGNLSVLAAMAGTPWAPDFRRAVVALEDIGEKPYRIDRMLTQLLQATNLGAAAGILLGDFTDCEAKAGEPSQTLAEVFEDRLGGLGIPVIGGFPMGHINHQLTWGYGEIREIAAR